MKALVTAAVLLLAASSLQAQMVVTNDTLDTERRNVRDALVILRDSLRTVEAAAAQFERGNASASSELLYSRGRTLMKSCSRSLRNVGPTRAVVEADDWNDEYRTLRQTELLAAMNHLEKSLQACESVWSTLATPAGADEIRSKGVTEARSISQEIHLYGNSVDAFYKALGIYVRPIGAGEGILP